MTLMLKIPFNGGTKTMPKNIPFRTFRQKKPLHLFCGHNSITLSDRNGVCRGINRRPRAAFPFCGHDSSPDRKWLYKRCCIRYVHWPPVGVDDEPWRCPTPSQPDLTRDMSTSSSWRTWCYAARGSAGCLCTPWVRRHDQFYRRICPLSDDESSMQELVRASDCTKMPRHWLGIRRHTSRFPYRGYSGGKTQHGGYCRMQSRCQDHSCTHSYYCGRDRSFQLDSRRSLQFASSSHGFSSQDDSTEGLWIQQ